VHRVLGEKRVGLLCSLWERWIHTEVREYRSNSACSLSSTHVARYERSHVHWCKIELLSRAQQQHSYVCPTTFVYGSTGWVVYLLHTLTLNKCFHQAFRARSFLERPPTHFGRYNALCEQQNEPDMQTWQGQPAFLLNAALLVYISPFLAIHPAMAIHKFDCLHYLALRVHSILDVCHFHKCLLARILRGATSGAKRRNRKENFGNRVQTSLARIKHASDRWSYWNSTLAGAFCYLKCSTFSALEE
jgi:hypothetical protein